MICNTCCNEYDGDICLTCYPYDTTKYITLSDPKNKNTDTKETYEKTSNNKKD